MNFFYNLVKGKSLPFKPISFVCVFEYGEHMQLYYFHNPTSIASLGTVACITIITIMLVRTYKKIRRKCRKATGEERSRDGVFSCI